MTLSSYLAPRGKRGIWQLRVPVPRAYQKVHGGPPERIRSLKTSDRTLAVKVALPILAEWQAEWTMPSSSGATPGAGTKGDLMSEVVEVGYDNLRAAMEGRRRAWPDDDQGYGEMVVKRERDLLRFVRQRQQGDLSPWQGVADRFLQNRGIPVDRESTAYREVLDAFAEVGIDAIENFVRDSKGEFGVEPRSPLVRRVKEASDSKAATGESLLELYDAYAKWRCQPGRKRRRRAESFEQDRVAVALFSEFIGHGRAVHSVTKAEAKAFRTMLGGFPASRAKNRKLANSSIVDCVAIAERDGLPLLSLTTQEKYLSILSPFFGWLVSDSPVSVPTNIFDGLHHKLERGENRRPSYSAGQLNILLQSPLFHSCGGNGREHLPGDIAVRDWRYWIPLLCLFTGSRITEVAQLQVDDVAVRDDVALVLLSHDEAKGQFLKNKKGRLAALHQTLIDAGFMGFWRSQVDRAKQDGNNQLFPELTAGKRALLGDMPSKWFRRFLPRLGIKEGADGYGAHSFRHTMTDAMRKAGYMDLEFGQLVLGHSNNSITAAYGSVPQGTPARLIGLLNDALKAEPFKDVDFSHLVAGGP